MTREEAVALLERYSNYDGMGIQNLAGCKEAMRVAVDTLKEAYPELAESEDERIREDLIGGLMWQRDNLKSEGPHDNSLILPGFCLTVGEQLAYLEKQKECFADSSKTSASEDERIRKQLIDAITIGRTNSGISFTEKAASRYIAWLEKHSEKEIQKIRKEEYTNEFNDAAGFEKQKPYEPHNWPADKNNLTQEQKPVESISQLTVQGKGVYKICPRCKERMVRDDSMVYTSMPPQYIYECPKCGERECDTVMYDSPVDEKQKEQKPTEFTHHEVDESLVEAVDHQMEDDGVVDDFVRRGLDDVVLKYAELGAKWQKEHKPTEIDEYEIIKKHITEDVISSEVNKRLKECGWYVTDERPAEWSEEENEKQIRQIERIVKDAGCSAQLQERIHNWLKSLRSSWKPSREQMRELYYALTPGNAFNFDALKELYEQLKKLM